MTFPRHIAAVLIGFLVAAWTWSGLARGEDPAKAPAAGVTVTVENTDGATTEGIFGQPTVRVKADFGAMDLDVRRIKSLVIEKQGEELLATATLLDKSTYHGALLTPTFTVSGKSLDPAQVKRVDFHHVKDTTLVSILVGLVTLVLLEIVLGVDNIIFITIVAAKLPVDLQPRARRIGLFAALGTRLLLLATLWLILRLTEPVFSLPPLPFLQSPEARELSWRDLILLGGGIFLIGKSVFEMHEKMEQAKAPHAAKRAAASFVSVIVQIAILDIIFSLDSVITAVGMVDDLWVMVVAVLIAVGVMMLAAESIGRFVDRRPTIKILALSFLILIGVLLVAEGLGQHFDKGYIYFAMAFAVAVEMVNLQLRGSQPQSPKELPAVGNE